MPKRKPDKPKRAKAVTTKRVQATEDQPPPKVPSVPMSAERDEDDQADDGLTIRQRSFVDAITGPAMGNATKAARMAGYSDSNVNVLKQTASETLAKPYIQEAIAHAFARKRLTPEWTRRQVADLATASLSHFVTVGPDGEPVVDWAMAAAAGAIGQLKELKEEGIGEAGGKVTIIKRTFKVHDRLRALELLARMQGLVTPEPAEAPERQVSLRPIRIGGGHAEPGSN